MSRHRRLLMIAAVGTLASGCHLLFGFEDPTSVDGRPPASESGRGQERRPGDGKPIAADGAPRPDSPFSDDFATANSAWAPANGSWSVDTKEGVYKGANCLVAESETAVSRSWGDVRARVKVREDDACLSGTFLPAAGLMLRVAKYSPPGCANNTYYMCLLEFPTWLGGGNRLSITDQKGDAGCMEQGDQASVPPLVAGEWYSLEFTAKGRDLTCRAERDGKSIGAVSWRDDGASYIERGSAGLIAEGIGASFDDFKVEPL
jgi:hypothetical protein